MIDGTGVSITIVGVGLLGAGFVLLFLDAYQQRREESVCTCDLVDTSTAKEHVAAEEHVRRECSLLRLEFCVGSLLRVDTACDVGVCTMLFTRCLVQREVILQQGTLQCMSTCSMPPSRTCRCNAT